MCFRTKVSMLMLALFIGAGVFSFNITQDAVATNMNYDTVEAVASEGVKAVAFDKLANLQQYIDKLKKQIVALQAKLEAAQQSATDQADWCHTFRRNLRYGSVGPEVRALQTALEKEELYEAGKKDPSGRFGMFTSSAVVAFQEKYVEDILKEYGLTHGTGFVGKTTRAKLNEIYGCVPGAPELPELPPLEPSEPPEPPVSPVTRECTDTDDDGINNGINKYEKGTACRDLYFVHPNLLDSDSSDSPAKKSFTKQFCRTDRCIARNITPKQNFGEGMPTKLKTRDAVKEYYCKGGKIFSKIMPCENGCFDGACKGEGLTPVCEDKCGDKICQENVCQGSGCPCAETHESCPEDCPESSSEECTTDAECEAIGGCTQVVGQDQAKCDLTTNECYCGGVCDDGYCDSVEERDGTCPKDCEENEASITVTYPDGGEQFLQGDSYTVTWGFSGSIDNVKITICMTPESYDQSAQSETRCDVGVVTDNDGSYSSQFGQAATVGNYTVKIEDASNSAIYDESDDYFSIVSANTTY